MYTIAENKAAFVKYLWNSTRRGSSHQLLTRVCRQTPPLVQSATSLQQ
jgi:hypothetical protein